LHKVQTQIQSVSKATYEWESLDCKKQSCLFWSVFSVADYYRLSKCNERL